MLAFSDESLTRLFVAATAVPRQRRARWLRETAQRLDGAEGRVDPAETRRAAVRERKRKQRLREKAGVRCAWLEIDGDIEELLRSSGVLRAWDNADNADVLGRAVERLLTKLAATSV